MTQNEALDILKMGQNVFLTGEPGSGKTFLLNKYIEYLKQHQKTVAVTASTGIAATHLNGITIHSWSGLGIKEHLSDKEIRTLMSRKYLLKRIRQTKVLIIDEVSMLKASQFDAVDKICQYFKASFLPFGGIQVVCSGDFFQLPPIERNVGEVQFINESGAWNNMEMKVCYLDEQHRHKDKNLSLLLNHIRENNIEDGRDMLARHQYQDNQRALITKLYTHNVDVDAINSHELSKIPSQEFVYNMTSTGPLEVVVALKKSCLSPENLTLKKGAKVMFIKNNFEEGYVNGTQGIVVGFDTMDMPIVQTFSGKKITAAKANWTIDNENGSTVAEIRQIPLRLAWAITVHKSQGMNLDAAEIDLSKCFIEGMGYVALSRLKTLGGLKLMGVCDMAFCVNEKAVHVDKEFKELSQRNSEYLKKIGEAKIQKFQQVFIS